MHERLGLDVSGTDLTFVYRAAALIMRQAVSLFQSNMNLKNIYDDKNLCLVLTVLLDQESLDVGRFFIKRCLAYFELLRATESNSPAVKVSWPFLPENRKPQLQKT